MCNMTRRRTLCSVMLIGLLTSAGSFVQADQNDLLRAMVLTGQNNHGWQVLSAHYKDILEDTGLFEVDVVTSPPSGADMSGFNKYRDGKLVLDDRPGHAGECVDAHEYEVITRTPDHPIMRGLPSVWLHGTDELYSNQRGPAKNMTILATAYSDPAREAHWGDLTHGTGEHEPIAHTVRYGQGRVFGTAMGHVDGGALVGSGPWPAMECVGFTTLIQRGAEWAATGEVTQPVPHGFPTATAVQFR